MMPSWNRDRRRQWTIHLLPTADFFGNDTFTYTATDSGGQTETGTVSVIILPAADAIDDTITTTEDMPVSGDVSTNDLFLAPPRL